MRQRKLSQVNKVIVDTHIQSVVDGKQTISVMMVHARNVEAVNKAVDTANIYNRVRKVGDGEWYEYLLYRNVTLYPLLDIIPMVPRNNKDHALLGFLFGYDPEAIADFIRTKGFGVSKDEH